MRSQLAKSIVGKGLPIADLTIKVEPQIRLGFGKLWVNRERQRKMFPSPITAAILTDKVLARD